MSQAGWAKVGMLKVDRMKEKCRTSALPADRGMARQKRLETKGIEPSFLRCDRSVLPLHHVPVFNAIYFSDNRRSVNVFLSAFRKIT